MMLRFPLEIKSSDRALWDKAVDDARAAAVRKEKAALMPERMEPPEGSFHGKLMGFQQEGLAFLLQHERCLLADEMGLGKTVQALSWLATTRSFPVMIIPPAHLTRNWQEEASRFLSLNGQPPRIHVIRGLKPYDLP